MRIARNLSQWTLVFLLLGGIASAQTILTDDAYIWSTTPKQNYGDNTVLFVGPQANTYLKFSFSSLPPGISSTNISGADVVLYVDAVFKPGTMDVYAVSGAWSENTVTSAAPPSPGSLLISDVPVNETGYLTLNLDAEVSAWLSNPSANNGIMLVPSPGSQISCCTERPTPQR